MQDSASDNQLTGSFNEQLPSQKTPQSHANFDKAFFDQSNEWSHDKPPSKNSAPHFYEELKVRDKKSVESKNSSSSLESL